MDGVLIISGVPGAGKTTVSRLLAERFSLAAHIEGDEIHDLVVGGRLHPQEEPHDEAMRQLRLRTKNVALLADSFARHGIVPVIDDVVVTPNRLKDYLADLETRPVMLVVLAPDRDVALERDRTRGYKQVGHIWGHLEAEMRSKLSGEGLWIDTSRLTPNETVEMILSQSELAVVSND